LGRAVLSHITPAQLATTNSTTNIAGTVASTVFGVTIEVIVWIIIFFFIGPLRCDRAAALCQGIVSLVSPEKRPRAHHILQQTAANAMV
jgi:hypothetical protein